MGTALWTTACFGNVDLLAARAHALKRSARVVRQGAQTRRYSGVYSIGPGPLTREAELWQAWR